MAGSRKKRCREELLDVRVARPSLLLGAMPLIARWYRRQHGAGAAPLWPEGVGASSRLQIIARTEEGSRFLRESLAQLESAALATTECEEAAHALGTAATLAWALGDLERAHRDACGALGACREADDRDSLCEVQSLLVRLERQMRASTTLRALGPPLPPAIAQVDRVRADELSVRQFMQRYALARRPCVFEGLGSEVVRDAPFDWQVAVWRQMLRSGEDPPSPAVERLRAAAARRVRLKRREAHSSEWARLEDAPLDAGAPETLGEVIDGLADGACGDYLFDWSLPINCPELLDGVRIPRYFAHDALQACASDGALYRESWPSLFLGAAGSSCALHVDTFGSHFWCALLDGRKRWVFFPPSQLGQLGVDFTLSADGAFDARADALADALHAMPIDELATARGALAALSSPWASARDLRPMVCELRAGDALFVPAGMPHAVRNSTGPALSLSANFIDATNLDSALAELELAALTDERARALVSQLEARGCGAAGSARRLYEIGEHVPFAEYKRGDPSAGGKWPQLDLATAEHVRACTEWDGTVGDPQTVSSSARSPMHTAVDADGGADRARARSAGEASGACGEGLRPFAFDPDELSADDDDCG
ncbi:hypothetical protein KFE25_000557 [Diacronema lutheri]|uniref:JmjC domain-containing protein n=1 Tax=Diacronema lutheri TaxID=2081491 RepID=A0A8J6CDM6_DIALT|nr:hypothetical protein KFE25_000557 [Diacronema lutheri]